MADGLAPDMPVAVIENAARADDARAARAARRAWPRWSTREQVQSPALIVIGEVAAAKRSRAARTRAGGRGMKILTGNDLKTGAVVWWDGSGWSLHVEDAVDAGEQAEAILAARGRRLPGQRRLRRSTPSRTADGVRPAHIKDRIRALGPTVRPDLTLKPADPDAGNWVI